MKRKAIVSYKYDKVEHLWCEVVMDFTLTGANIMLSSVVEELANKSLVWKIAGQSLPLVTIVTTSYHSYHSYH